MLRDVGAMEALGRASAGVCCQIATAFVHVRLHSIEARGCHSSSAVGVIYCREFIENGERAVYRGTSLIRNGPHKKQGVSVVSFLIYLKWRVGSHAPTVHGFSRSASLIRNRESEKARLPFLN